MAGLYNDLLKEIMGSARKQGWLASLDLRICKLMSDSIFG